jgi:hypothetical protein
MLDARPQAGNRRQYAQQRHELNPGCERAGWKLFLVSSTDKVGAVSGDPRSEEKMRSMLNIAHYGS